MPPSALVAPAPVSLVSPLPASWYPRLWAWVQEDPTANLDDDSPRTAAAFRLALQTRAAIERTWGVLVDETPVGYPFSCGTGSDGRSNMRPMGSVALSHFSVAERLRGSDAAARRCCEAGSLNRERGPFLLLC
jgi:hypothetical protein